MKKKMEESGFVLVTLLIFISILSEMILFMMNSSIFTSRTMENIFTYFRYVYKTDIALEQVKQTIFDKDFSCIRHWCSVEGDFLKNREKLEYKIELLQTAPCFQIKDSEKIGADFFKISIRLLNQQDAMHIERTLVTTTESTKKCTQQIKIIEPGFLSWRVVPHFS